MSGASFADFLVTKGLLSEPQRSEAVRLSEQSRCGLGEAVARLGYSSEEAVAAALAQHLGYAYASQENRLLIAEGGQDLEDLVPEVFARQHSVLPLFQESNLLAVALADPENFITLENLRVLTKCDIQPFVAAKSQLLRAIDGFYGKGSADLLSKAMASAGTRSVETAEPGRREAVDLDRAGEGGGEAATVNIVNAMLKQAVTERCSDIHLETFEEEVVLRFRIDGVLYPRQAPPGHLFSAIVSRIKILSRLDVAERRLPQDGMFSLTLHNRKIDVRVSVCPADYGEKVVLRVLDKGAVELHIDKIGLEPRQREDFLAAAREPHGLIFLTGPTGSGKTTTLYTLLSTINVMDMNFMTIEDPIEIKLRGVTQVQVKPAIGLNFASALRSFLRQDPDVILVGEVRDAETAQTCLRAAMTGHLVLSSLHTNDSLSSVVRLLDLGIEPFLLSSTLMLVASQRLVRVLCPACKKPGRPTPEILKMCQAEARLGEPLDPAQTVFYTPTGCPECFKTGYRGRVGIYEVCRINEALREVISKDRADLAKLRSVAAQSGMINLRASGWRKALRGITSVEEVFSLTSSWN